MSDEERKQLARILSRLRFKVENPDYNIRAALDEPVEQVVIADFYNTHVAEWLARETGWRWLPAKYSDFSDIRTVRDLSELCYDHLALANG
jgi:hypothetical protein